MHYLYHRVPDNMEEDTLYPLNILKQKYPEAFQEHTHKYAGREHLMDYKIPTLGCLWNDVIHLTAVHPSDLTKALIGAGAEKFEKKYFQIDPFSLDPQNTIVYLYDKMIVNQVDDRNFEPYDPHNMEKYSHIPQDAKDYYKEMFTQGQRPLMYVRIPHILFKGSIDVSDVPIIETAS